MKARDWIGFGPELQKPNLVFISQDYIRISLPRDHTDHGFCRQVESWTHIARK